MFQTTLKRSVLSLLTAGIMISAPVVLAEDGGMSLAEAVKTTLDLSPTRYIQQAGVTQAQAGVSIAEGAFNPTPSAGFNVGQNSAPLASVPYNALANGPYSQYIFQQVPVGDGRFVNEFKGYGPGPDTPFRYQNT
ncbi:MAG: hypothetical protein ACR2HF_03495, partial [Methylococcaceae bacterium]